MKLDTSAYIEVARESANDDTVILVGWDVDEGEKIAEGDKICEIETSKSLVEIHAHRDGWLFHLQSDGDEVPVGEPLGVISDKPQKPTLAQTPSKLASSGPGPKISRKAADLIKEHKIDVRQFAELSIVRERDVEAVIAEKNKDKIQPSGGRVEPLTPRQRRAAKVLSEAYAQIPHSYLHRWIDASATENTTEQHAQAHDLAASVSDLLVYACAKAAAEYEKANASWSDNGITYHETVNVGFALNMSNGDLVVPVVHAAENMGFDEVVAHIRNYQKLALRHRLTADDMSDGTITVTSMVGSGVQQVFPIIVPGTSMIVALGDAHEGSQCLTVAFDHRLVNGTEAGAFLMKTAAFLEGTSGGE